MKFEKLFLIIIIKKIIYLIKIVQKNQFLNKIFQKIIFHKKSYNFFFFLQINSISLLIIGLKVIFVNYKFQNFEPPFQISKFEMIYAAVRNLQFQKFEIVYFAWVLVPSNFKFERLPAFQLSKFLAHQISTQGCPPACPSFHNSINNCPHLGCPFVGFFWKTRGRRQRQRLTE